METPIMLVVTIVAARSMILRLGLPFTPSARLGTGFTAVLMLIAEFGFVLWIRGLSIKEYFSTRDPVSASVSDGVLPAPHSVCYHAVFCASPRNR
jgi:type IV secretory pathway TrbD component